MVTVVEIVGHHDVALAAHVAHPRDTRRCGAVIPVAVVARGRRRVSAFAHRVPVDAPLVVGLLVRRDSVPVHQRRVFMAGGTGERDVGGVRLAARVRRAPDEMRVISLGTGMPSQRPSQAAVQSIFIPFYPNIPAAQTVCSGCADRQQWNELTLGVVTTMTDVKQRLPVHHG